MELLQGLNRICLHESNQEDGSGCCHCKRCRLVGPELRGFTIQLDFIHAVCCLVCCYSSRSFHARELRSLIHTLTMCKINFIFVVQELLSVRDELYVTLK
jgi:hypothetical protein